MRRHLLAAFALAWLAVSPSWAQVPFPPGYDAAQRAFDALPADERRALQLALVWTGDFSGMATGEFGRLTFQGLSNFQRRQGMARPNAVLDTAQRRALDQAAARARTAARFETRAEPRAGVRVGLPMAHVDTRLETDRGMRFAASDQRFTLETLVNPLGQSDLEALHERLSRPEGARTVAYQVLRPDFFVVSGALSETRRYYTRVNRRGAELVGYTVTWMPDRMPEFDRINVAIANAFDAGGTPAAMPPGPSVAATPPQRPADPPPAPVAQGPSATAVLVGPGLAVVPASAIQGCRTLTVAGRPSRVTGSDAGSGLALLTVESTATPARMTDESPAEGQSLLFLAQGAGGVQVAPTSAVLIAGQLEPAIPVQQGQTGGVLADRSGRVVGIVVGPGRVRTVAVGGVATPAPQRVAAGAEVLRATGRAPAGAAQPMSTVDIALALSPALMPVVCAR